MIMKLSSALIVVLLATFAVVHAVTYNTENDYTKTWVVSSSYNDSSCGINLLSASAFQSGVCVFISGTEWAKYTWDGTLITQALCTDSACTSCTSTSMPKDQCNAVSDGTYQGYSVTTGLPPVASSLQTTAVYSESNCSGFVGLVKLTPNNNCQNTSCEQDGNTYVSTFCGFPTFSNDSTSGSTPSGGDSTPIANDLTKHWLVVGNFNGSKCSNAQLTMGHAYQIEVCTVSTPGQYVLYTAKNNTNGINMLICTDSACTQCGAPNPIQLNKCNATMGGNGYNAYYTSWGLPAAAAHSSNLAIYDQSSCNGVVSSVLINPTAPCQDQACYSLGNGRSASGSCGYPAFAVGSTYGNSNSSGDINGFNTVNDFSKFWIVVSQYNDIKCSSGTFLSGNAYQIGVCAKKNSTEYVKYSYDGTTATRLTCIDPQCEFCNTTQTTLNQCSASIYGGYVSFTYSQGLPAIGASGQSTAIYDGGNCSGVVGIVTMSAIQSGQVCEEYDACTVGYNQSSTFSCGFPRFPLGSTFVSDTSDDSADFNSGNDITKAWLVVEIYNDTQCTSQFIHGKAYQIGVCLSTSENQYTKYTYDGASVTSKVCSDDRCNNCAPYQLPLGTCSGGANGYSTYFFSQGLPAQVGKMESAAYYNGDTCDGIVNAVEYEPVTETVNCSALTCTNTSNDQSVSYFCGFPEFAFNSTYVAPIVPTDSPSGPSDPTSGGNSAPTESSNDTDTAPPVATTTVTIVMKMDGDINKVDATALEAAISTALGVSESAVSVSTSNTDPTSLKRDVATFYLIVKVMYNGLLSAPSQSVIAASMNSTVVQKAFASQNIGVNGVSSVSTVVSTAAPTTTPTNSSDQATPTDSPTSAPTNAPGDHDNGVGSTIIPSVVLAFAAVAAVSLL